VSEDPSESLIKMRPQQQKNRPTSSQKSEDEKGGLGAKMDVEWSASLGAQHNAARNSCLSTMNR
jgi:hypothetical protein